MGTHIQRHLWSLARGAPPFPWLCFPPAHSCSFQSRPNVPGFWSPPSQNPRLQAHPLSGLPICQPMPCTLCPSAWPSSLLGLLASLMCSEAAKVPILPGVCITQLCTTVTNTWDQQLGGKQDLFGVEHGGFSSWLCGTFPSRSVMAQRSGGSVWQIKPLTPW